MTYSETGVEYYSAGYRILYKKSVKQIWSRRVSA